MKTNDIIAGMQLLAKHRQEPNGYDLAAEHEEIYLYPSEGDTPLSETEVQEMYKLGWFQVGNMEGEYERYDHEEGWMGVV